jgi:hypothetical protein
MWTVIIFLRNQTNNHSSAHVAIDMGWKNLWIESNSQNVMLAFSSEDIMIPWVVRNRCRNCIHLVKWLNNICTHTFKEGNVKESHLI